MYLTWRTKWGMIAIAAAVAIANHETLGASAMLGMWLIWDDISQSAVTAGSKEGLSL